MCPGLVPADCLLRELRDLASAGVPADPQHPVPGRRGGVQEGERRDLSPPVLLGGPGVVDGKQLWLEKELLCNTMVRLSWQPAGWNSPSWWERDGSSGGITSMS